MSFWENPSPYAWLDQYGADKVLNKAQLDELLKLAGPRFVQGMDVNLDPSNPDSVGGFYMEDPMRPGGAYKFNYKKEYSPLDGFETRMSDPSGWDGSKRQYFVNGREVKQTYDPATDSYTYDTMPFTEGSGDPWALPQQYKRTATGNYQSVYPGDFYERNLAKQIAHDKKSGSWADGLGMAIGAGFLGAGLGSMLSGAGTGWTGTAAELAADGLGGIAPSGFGVGSAGGGMGFFDTVSNIFSNPLDSLGNLFSSGGSGMSPIDEAINAISEKVLSGEISSDVAQAGINSLLENSAAISAGGGSSLFSTLSKMPTSVLKNLVSGGNAGGMNIGSILGGIAGASGFGQGKEAGKITNTVEPWGPMQPYLMDAASRLKSSFKPNTPDYLTNIHNQYMGGLGALGDLGNMGASGYFDPFLEDTQNIQMPEDPNPYLDGITTALNRDANRNLTENVLPAIRSGAVANGYGGSRQGIAEGLAASRSQQDVTDAMAQQRAQAYENYQGRKMNANQFNANLGMNRSNQNMAASSLALQNRMAPIQAMQNSLVQGFGLGNQMNNYDFNQAAQYANAMRGLGGMGQSSSQPYFDNPMGNAMGMAQLGGKVWNGLFN